MRELSRVQFGAGSAYRNNNKKCKRKGRKRDLRSMRGAIVALSRKSCCGSESTVTRSAGRGGDRVV